MIKRFLLIGVIAALLYCSPSLAEDEQKGLMHDYSDFSGGLNSKTSEYSLPKNQGTVCENIRFDTEKGSISKRNEVNLFGTVDSANPILGLHRFYLVNAEKVLLCNYSNKIRKYDETNLEFDLLLTLTTGDKRWQWTTWHDLAVGTDGYNQPVKYDGSSDSATYVGSCLATDAGSGAGPDGTYTYKVGFYTATYTVLFNVASNSVTVTDNDINLTMLPIGPDSFLGEEVVGRKVYRTTTGGTSYLLLSNGTIANNTATTLTDSDADGALGAAMPTVDNATIFADTPPCGRFILIHDNRLWIANNPSSYPSRVYYSDDGSHDYFPSDNYLDIRQNDGDSITFMKQVLGMLTIGKNNTIQKIYTDGEPDEWSISDPLTNIGCQAPYSASNTPIGLFYLATDGIYKFNGQFASLVSEVVTPEINDINPTDLNTCWGIYHNSTYYLAYPSKAIGQSYNDRVLVFNLLSNAYSIDLLNINCFSAFNNGSDFGVLYAGSSLSASIYSFSDEINEVIHRRHSDFSGLWDDMRYIPESVGGVSSSPILEISRTETINELTGTINNLIGVIDREDKNGHYVSQPISTNGYTLEKLYWNETIPSGGGDVAFQLRTSTTGEQSLVRNDCFELWDNYPTVSPNDWTAVSTSTTVTACASNTTVVKRGTYSARVNTEATITQTLVSPTTYRGQTLVFNGWTNSASTVADKVYLEIGDGYTTSRAYRHSLVAGWENTYTTITVNTTATTITLKCANLSNADAPSYFDQLMVKQGTTCSNDWSAWSAEFGSSGSDISSVTASKYLQYMTNMSTTLITQTPNIYKSDGYCVKVLYAKDGVPESSSIPLVWESGFNDYGRPGYIKTLRKLYVVHEATDSGTLTITFENEFGDTDVFEIDLSTYPEKYIEYFTTGAFTGKWIKMRIENDDRNALTIKKVYVMYDVEPLK